MRIPSSPCYVMWSDDQLCPDRHVIKGNLSPFALFNIYLTSVQRLLSLLWMYIHWFIQRNEPLTEDPSMDTFKAFEQMRLEMSSTDGLVLLDWTHDSMFFSLNWSKSEDVTWASSTWTSVQMTPLANRHPFYVTSWTVSANQISS